MPVIWWVMLALPVALCSQGAGWALLSWNTDHHLVPRASHSTSLQLLHLGKYFALSWTHFFVNSIYAAAFLSLIHSRWVSWPLGVVVGSDIRDGRDWKGHQSVSPGFLGRGMTPWARNLWYLGLALHIGFVCVLSSGMDSAPLKSMETLPLSSFWHFSQELISRYKIMQRNVN